MRSLPFSWVWILSSWVCHFSLRLNNYNNLNRNIPYIHHKIRDSISVSSMSRDMICWIEIHLVQKSIYYISFQWMGLSCEFCCLNPGFSSTLKAFTKLMKALYLYWKIFVSGSKNILIIYNSWKCRDKKLLWAQYILKFIFDQLGSLINIKKSLLTQTSTLEPFG